jgi:hypothetical protein
MEVREEHQDNPRGTRDVLTSQTVTEDIAKMKGTRPQWAFIQAVEAQGDADWSSQHFTLIIGCEEDNKTPLTLKALINQYQR